METPSTLNVYMTVKQVTDRLVVSTDTVFRWKRKGTFPAAVRLGPGTTRWRLSDVLEYEGQLQACFATCVALPNDFAIFNDGAAA